MTSIIPTGIWSKHASANPRCNSRGCGDGLISILGFTMMGGSSTAPDFEAQWVGGENDGSIKLSDLQGKVVILDLMATTCSPCKDIMMICWFLYEKYKDDPGVVIISLSVGEDTPEGYLLMLKIMDMVDSCIGYKQSI